MRNGQCCCALDLETGLNLAVMRRARSGGRRSLVLTHGGRRRAHFDISRRFGRSETGTLAFPRPVRRWPVSVVSLAPFCARPASVSRSRARSRAVCIFLSNSPFRASAFLQLSVRLTDDRTLRRPMNTAEYNAISNQTMDSLTDYLEELIETIAQDGYDVEYSVRHPPPLCALSN